MNKKDEKRLNSKRMQQRIQNIAKIYVKDSYKLFSNPICRGEKFCWKDFPKITAGIAKVSAFTCFANWDSFSIELQETIEKQVYELTEGLAQKKLDENIQ